MGTTDNKPLLFRTNNRSSPSKTMN
jgi:hypothetical protein